MTAIAQTQTRTQRVRALHARQQTHRVHHHSRRPGSRDAAHVNTPVVFHDSSYPTALYDTSVAPSNTTLSNQYQGVDRCSSGSAAVAANDVRILGIALGRRARSPPAARQRLRLAEHRAPDPSSSSTAGNRTQLQRQRRVRAFTPYPHSQVCCAAQRCLAPLRSHASMLPHFKQCGTWRRRRASVQGSTRHRACTGSVKHSVSIPASVDLARRNSHRVAHRPPTDLHVKRRDTLCSGPAAVATLARAFHLVRRTAGRTRPVRQIAHRPSHALPAARRPLSRLTLLHRIDTAWMTPPQLY
jgi:hypothetical protein